MPARIEMPRTIRRSPPKAQRTWAKTHDRAVEQYGEGERAHRTAMASPGVKTAVMGGQEGLEADCFLFDQTHARQNTAAHHFHHRAGWCPRAGSP